MTIGQCYKCATAKSGSTARDYWVVLLERILSISLKLANADLLMMLLLVADRAYADFSSPYLSLAFCCNSVIAR